MSAVFRFCLVWLALVLTMGSAVAVEFTKNFYLPMGLDFDTNINMGQLQKKDVTRLILIPRLQVTGQDDLNTYTLDTSLFFANSSDQGVSEDRRDPTGNVGWSRNFERGVFSAGAMYTKQSIRASEMATTGAVFLDLTSVMRSVNANLDYELNDKLILGTGVTYMEQEFTGNALIGFTSQLTHFKLTQLYSEKFTPFYKVDFNKFTNQINGISTNARNLSVGGSYLIGPKSNFTASAGINNIESLGSSWIGMASLNYSIDESSTITGSLARSVAPVGLGGFQKSDNMMLGYSKSFTDKDSVGLSYVWSINKTLNEAEFKNLSAWYDKQIAQEWALRFTASQRSLSFIDREAEAIQVGVSLIYSLLDF